MAGPTFDPNDAVRFDLRNGTASDARGARLLLVPSAALEILDDAALSRVGAELGRAVGARVAATLGGGSGVRSATLEDVVSHLAGELAVSGACVFHVERWGKAMVAVVTNPSITNEAFLGALLAGAIGAASGREVFAEPLGRSGATSRFFLGSRATGEKVRRLVGEGRAYGEVVASLQGSAS